MKVFLPLCLALLAAPVAACAGLWCTRWAPRAGALMAALAFSAVLWGWHSGGGDINVAWAPTWNLRLHFTLDGLAALYALLATGIGCAVTLYAAGYLPHHLAKEHLPATQGIRFYTFLLLFMGAMVGLVMAQDLLLIFLFWDLTTITSYYLIGYDRHRHEARIAAAMALLITGIAAVGVLIAAMLLYAEYQTFSLPELRAQAQPHALLTTAMVLMVGAAVAKSAQIPLHFWLPRAMAAPTPVSAYLHSAAMVAAGVFLLARLSPLIRLSPPVLEGLQWVGWLSICTGGILALLQDRLKAILAYSTISQYGYVVVMLSLGSGIGAVAAAFYVLAHGMIKSTLFLTAGAVTTATGAEQLSHLGGLGRTMPVLAVTSGVAAAGLAGLPLTSGFFKDEVFFKALLEQGWPLAGLAVLGAGLTLAYIWRFWSGIFLGGNAHHRPERLPAAMLAPIVVLSGGIVYGGLFPSPLVHLAEAAGQVTNNAPTPLSLAYHIDARPENLLALATYMFGVILILSRPLWISTADLLLRLGAPWGPERLYTATLQGLNHVANRLHKIEVYDLRNRIATVLWSTIVLLGIGGFATASYHTFRIGVVQGDDLPVLLALLLTVLCALATVLPRNHLVLLVAVSAVAFSLATVFALLGAPDVALVIVLIDTMTTLLFLGILTLFPTHVLPQKMPPSAGSGLRWRNRVLSVLSGGAAFMVAWGVLSQQPFTQSIAQEHARLTPAVHAKDVVTAILADFRGLDTLGELTVMLIALLGVMALLGGKGPRP